MNKKVLLLALPAFMVLSGCNARAIEKPVNNQPALEMCEDNLAHEEIFGGEQDTVVLTKKSPYKVALTTDSVKIGYQIQFNANGEGTADDRISIRFVAALTNEVATANWHRGLAQPNGYEGADVGGGVWKYKFDDGTSHPSTKFYTALNNGGDKIEATKGDFVGYSCFAIYTLINIPYETYKDSYLAAYVTLTSDNTINSQAVAVKIEKDGNVSKNAFFFSPDATGHFLQGTIGGTLKDGKTNPLLYATEYGSGNYYAAFDGLEVNKDTDSFGSFYFNPSHFQFFGYSSFFDGSSLYFNESASLSGYASPKANGTYNLKVYSGSTPTENHVFASSTVSGADQNYVLKNMQNWLADASAVLIANIHCANDSWMYAMVPFVTGEGDGDAYTGSASFVAPNNIVEFELLRCVPGTNTTNVQWDKDHIWNITTGKINVSGTNVYAFNASEWKGY